MSDQEDMGQLDQQIQSKPAAGGLSEAERRAQQPMQRLAPKLQSFIDQERALYEEQTNAAEMEAPSMAKAQSVSRK